MTPADDLDQGHLRPEQVAAYLDRQLTGAEQATAEAHLAGCRSCREELVEVARLRRARPRWRRWYVVAPAAAAAAALIVLAVRQPAGLSPPGNVLRGSSSEGVARFATVGPSPTEPVAPERLVFVWRSAGSAATYRLTVTQPSGSVVWTSSTSDTTGTLPETLNLGRGQAYFWYVDALLPDGRSATTGVRQFRTAP